jgi:hypothetical protein
MGCGASSASPYVADVSPAAARPKLSSAEILSSVRGYVESRAFAAPLSNWIDDNCVTFTEDCMSDPNMEPSYRAYHSQYIEFTDALLKAHLIKFACSLTKFYRAQPRRCGLALSPPATDVAAASTCSVR